MGIERAIAREQVDEARVRIAALREIFEATLAHRKP
jgi:hypothetical protein